MEPTFSGTGIDFAYEIEWWKKREQCIEAFGCEECVSDKIKEAMPTYLQFLRTRYGNAAEEFLKEADMKVVKRLDELVVRFNSVPCYDRPDTADFLAGQCSLLIQGELPDPKGLRQIVNKEYRNF